RYLAVAAHVIRAHVDAARRFVDVDADVAELPAVAVRSLDRLDRYLVAGSAGDEDLTRDVAHAHGPIARQLDLPRDAIGLFRPAVAALIRRRQMTTGFLYARALRRRVRSHEHDDRRHHQERVSDDTLSMCSVHVQLFSFRIRAAPASLPLRISLINATVSCSRPILVLKLSSRLCCAGSLFGCVCSAARLSPIAWSITAKFFWSVAAVRGSSAPFSALAICSSPLIAFW